MEIEVKSCFGCHLLYWEEETGDYNCSITREVIDEKKVFLNEVDKDCPLKDGDITIKLKKNA